MPEEDYQERVAAVRSFCWWLAMDDVSQLLIVVPFR
jgi:hypothetical protein